MRKIRQWLVEVLVEAFCGIGLADRLTLAVRGDVNAQLALMKMTPYQPMVVKGLVRAGDQVVINLTLGEIHSLNGYGYAINGPMMCVQGIAKRDFRNNQIVPINGTNLNDDACGFGAEPMYSLPAYSK